MGEKGEFSGKNIDESRIFRLSHLKVIIFGIDNDLDKCYYTINSERQSILLAEE